MPSPITLVGHPRDATGRGEHIRAIHRAFLAAGRRVAVYDVMRRPEPGETLSPELAADLVDVVGEGIRVFHFNGIEIEPLLALMDKRQPGFFARGCNIVFPAWELPHFPKVWARQVERFDEVWTASLFVDEAMREAVGIPVVHLPNACEPHISQPLGREHFGVPEGRYAILYFFDFGSYLARKNPFAAIAAMRALMAARPAAPVQFVLKVSRSSLDPAGAGGLAAALEGFGDRATLIDAISTDNEAKTLIACCDCFLSLHRSEGFGRGPAEAMFLGKPVVATSWSGNMTYMNDAVAVPVPFTLIPVGADEYLFPEGQLWAEPDIDAAVLALIGLVDDPERGRRLGERARRHMRSRFADEILGRRYLRRMAAIARSRGGAWGAAGSGGRDASPAEP